MQRRCNWTYTSDQKHPLYKMRSAIFPCRRTRTQCILLLSCCWTAPKLNKKKNLSLSLSNKRMIRFFGFLFWGKKKNLNINEPKVHTNSYFWMATASSHTRRKHHSIEFNEHNTYARTKCGHFLQRTPHDQCASMHHVEFRYFFFLYLYVLLAGMQRIKKQKNEITVKIENEIRRILETVNRNNRRA